MASSGDHGDLTRNRDRHHGECWVCGSGRAGGLDVRFHADGSGGVRGEFPCPACFTGYDGFIHGGVVSSLLDGAMANCLFLHDWVGVTADLQVRFLEPVRTGEQAVVRAWIDQSRRAVQILGAELVQEGRVRATARGKFMRHNAVPSPA